MKFLFLFSLLFFSLPVKAQTIYLKPSEALKTIFHTSEEIIPDKKTLTSEQKEILKKKIGYAAPKDDWTFYIAKTKGSIDGYAVVDNEVGKTEPITFLTVMTPQGSVHAVEILVYREPYGSEVHEERFLKQFDHKTTHDPIKLDQDITHMTGATLSSRAMTVGVKRDLALWEIFYSK